MKDLSVQVDAYWVFMNSVSREGFQAASHGEACFWARLGYTVMNRTTCQYLIVY